jgi:hypothetical protein
MLHPDQAPSFEGGTETRMKRGILKCSSDVARAVVFLPEVFDVI